MAEYIPQKNIQLAVKFNNHLRNLISMNIRIHDMENVILSEDDTFNEDFINELVDNKIIVEWDGDDFRGWTWTVQGVLTLQKSGVSNEDIQDPTSDF